MSVAIRNNFSSRADFRELGTVNTAEIDVQMRAASQLSSDFILADESIVVQPKLFGQSALSALSSLLKLTAHTMDPGDKASMRQLSGIIISGPVRVRTYVLCV